MFMQNQTAFGECEKVVALIKGGRHTAARVTSGLVAGSLVETAEGWRPVETLSAGDTVYTFDGGLRPVRRVDRTSFGADLSAAYPDGLLFVPGGALDNCSELYLLPDQHILIESTVAEEVLGTPTTLIPASALEGHRGVMRVMPVDLIEVYTLIFDDEELVFANSGLMVHCPAKRQLATAGVSAITSNFFEVLDYERAIALIELIETGAMTTDDVAQSPKALITVHRNARDGFAEAA